MNEPEAPSGDGGAPPTILIVDDHPANLLAAVAVLEALGYAIVTAASGAEALERARAQDFVMILMDIQMPGLDGFETTALLRQHERSREVPVIFLTAVYNQLEHVHRGYALGAADFISKPFDAEVLRAKVRALVSLYLRGQRAERARSDEIDRIKDLFLGAVGHDLRTPLSSILMSSELMAKRACSEESHRAHAERIQRAGRRMNRIIDDLLDLTRGQFTAGIPVSLVPVNLGEVCRAVIGELQVAHPDRGLELEIAGDLHVLGDGGRLARVVSNLAGNAVQHTVGAVRVSALEEGDNVVIRVHNDGEPISAAAMTRLFEPFRRGDTSSQGLGLGLYIVREIARAHGGTAAVASNEAEGTTFSVTLPKRPFPVGASESP